MRETTPILYSFRRCPYAMRARLALQASGCTVALREIALADKPQAFLAASPSATVPCLVHADGVIDESLDIMVWALQQNDPHRWLEMPQLGHALIAQTDGPFKHALDRVKYASRYPDEDADQHLNAACGFLHVLDDMLEQWLFDTPTLADYAILPFVRQFAFIDKKWFDDQGWPYLQKWLDRFLDTPEFADIMIKHPQWQPCDAPVFFPAQP
ncbi:glutathione S-transferase [uncultured Sulfitobacter sp.]|uniref:glutathione S-transferase n=1 Tax=uncultured Sulfitobacter sp. TaxID=191468 RepID=UPI00261A0A83|nr:glutathione S-transferase [uncultured Sulfitobacter sp.]